MSEVHVSPSQIGTRIDCVRKWAYSRVRPRTENKSAAFGTRSHTVAEDWLRDGKAPDVSTREGECIAAGLHLLPMPGHAEVERRFDFTFDGVVYTGRIDLLYGYDPGRVIVVGDHKTTGDLFWRKQPEQLADDPQRVVYATWAGSFFAVPHVVSQWIYYQRPASSRPAKAENTVFAEPLGQTVDRFVRLHETHAKPIMRDASNPDGIDPDQFERTGFPEACSKYGGCPYKAECLGGMSTLDRAAASLIANTPGQYARRRVEDLDRAETLAKQTKQEKGSS